ncbi:hypothetical protein GCM10010347_05740 [Streptomyces cirratus]|uniref:Uncharacterized protein n=1 Tax=Streptomyces cirratus TaxID=68187 RepID=A0ABQ3EKP4_9ACTN|nr:hypothetical protein GCM10010347_05740 [Streptomyces cirratus]
MPAGGGEDERGGGDHPEGAGVDEEELLFDPDREGGGATVQAAQSDFRLTGARGAVARFDHYASLDIRVFSS